MTWSHFVSFTQDQGVAKQLGGGMIGGILFAASYYLFSAAGAKIVSVFSMLIGILFFTNFSIGNSYAKIKQISKNLHEKIQKNRQNAQKKKAKKVQSPAQHDMQVETAEEMDMPTPSTTPDDLDVRSEEHTSELQ